uniref:Uncharacterized protein n=1 Tax=Triticum urartu TaxID=4572 RepID=A0A8R7P464_TRIUA
MAGFLTSSAMIHCSPVAVVSVPAIRNSEQSMTISSSVSARPASSSGSLTSSRVSTYECSNVVSAVGNATPAPRSICFLRSRRASISGRKSSFCRRRRARPVLRRPRNRCLVTAGQKAKTLVFRATYRSQSRCAAPTARTAASSSLSPKHMSTRRQNMAYRNASMTMTPRGAASTPGLEPDSRSSLSASTRRTQARAGAKRRTRDGCSVSDTRLRRRRRHAGP